MAAPKRKVISISYPAWAGEEYMKDFESKYDLHTVIPGDRQTTIDRLAAKAKSDGPFDAIAILMGIKLYEPFDEELLSSLLPQCKIMASASAGYNEFDVDWMSRNGIIFCNSRNAVNESTADLAIFFMLGIIRDVQRLSTSIAKGTWRGKLRLDNIQGNPPEGILAPTRDPAGMRLGILGMGSIGKHVARRAKVFNMKISYWQRTRLLPDEEALYDATWCSSLDELLSTADVLTVHCPLNDKTEGLIGREQFAKMKDGVFLVNTSRGPVIQEEALIEALESGKVARAGLDVFDSEPKINPYFIRNDRVMIQPHMGGISDIAWQRAYREALENIRSFLETGKAISPVNMAEIQQHQQANGTFTNGTHS